MVSGAAPRCENVKAYVYNEFFDRHIGSHVTDSMLDKAERLVRADETLNLQFTSGSYNLQSKGAIHSDETRDNREAESRNAHSPVSSIKLIRVGRKLTNDIETSSIMADWWATRCC